MKPTAHNALIATLGTVLGLVVGSLSVFTFLEKRITETATEKTATAMRIQSVELRLSELKSDFWTDKAETRAALGSLQSLTSAANERLLKLELTKPEPMNRGQ